MNKCSVELSIESDGEENLGFSDLSENDIAQWKKDMETRALRERKNGDYLF